MAGSVKLLGPAVIAQRVTPQDAAVLGARVNASAHDDALISLRYLGLWRIGDERLAFPIEKCHMRLLEGNDRLCADDECLRRKGA